MEKFTINYHAIYADILEDKFPEKKKNAEFYWKSKIYPPLTSLR
jgi:hypothetical protein